MKLKGNLICLENLLSYKSDTLDAYKFPKPRIKQLYFHANNYGDEFVDIIYNNGYAETCLVENKKASSKDIRYDLCYNRHLLIKNDDNVNFVIWNDYRNRNNNYTDYSNYHEIQLYSISSISYSKERPQLALPTFNDIRSYKVAGEVKGNVKSVSHATFLRKQMFGKDSLIFMHNYITQYDDNNNLTTVFYNQSKERPYVLNTYEYDINGNIVSECRKDYSERGTIVKYERDENNLVQMISYYKGRKKVAYTDLAYDSNKDLKELNRYEYSDYSHEYRLDQIIKFEKDGSDDCILGIEYDNNGEEVRRNKYDKNYSLLQGMIDFGRCSEFYNPFKKYVYNNTSRYCDVTNNEYNISIGIRYPYTKPEYGSIKTFECLTYNKDCNLVKREIEEYDCWSHSTSRDKYIVIYKYDDFGNWIERHSILNSHKVDGEEVQTSSKGFIEYRDIVYFEN